MLFDTHAHLNDDAYLDDLEETIERAKEAGVKLINIVGFDDKSIEKALEITSKYDFLYLTIGWHPVEAIDFTDEKCKDVETIVVSAGKVGHQVEVKPEVLEQLIGAKIVDITA